MTDDLEVARMGSVCVEVVLLSGKRLRTGVKEVCEDEGWVSLFDPQVMGDDLTYRRIDLEFIQSVTVTDIAW